jgi:hypothetical protein
MSQDVRSARLSNAAVEFDRHEGRTDGSRVVRSLDDGLSLLRESLYVHLHQEMEITFGVDSMLTPVSEVKTRQQVMAEIELYQAAESAVIVAEKGYLPSDGPWYSHWLARARLGPIASETQNGQRLAEYTGQDPDQRRLTLTDILVTVIAEARRAPLVLFRLFPLAVRIVTATAFGDPLGASQIRAGQIECLPAIEDCRQCRGQVLPNGQQCPACGNPLWKTKWLMTS